MKLHYYKTLLLMTAVLVIAGCQKEMTTEGSSNIDLTKMTEVSLDAISLSDGLTRAAGATPMAIGETFRLYAFAKGQTDITQLLVTRAYFIEGVAGKPVLANGEEKLFLPIGDVDIYLVGPLSKDINEEENKVLPDANKLNPYIVEVATASGVHPHQGVDLISSKTEIKIIAGKVNTLRANPLKHRMARMDVRVSRPEKPVYENLLLKEVKVYDQALKGNFTFNSDGGAVESEANGGTDITTHSFIEEVAGDSYRATLYMIPRPETELKLEVRFSCNQIGMTSMLDKRLTSGLITAQLKAGEQNLFWSSPELSPTILWRWKLLPWNDVDQGTVSVPQYGDLYFSYSGLDAPIEINGKKYWRDRSGNGNHAEIVGDMIYDPIEKCYKNGLGSPSWFVVPSLGKIDGYTLEFSVESVPSPMSTVAYFSDDRFDGNRCVNIHLPWENNTVYFDTGDINANGRRASYTFGANDLNMMNHFSTYYFSRNGVWMAIGRNGREYRYRQPSPTTFGAFTYNKLWVLSTVNSTYSPNSKEVAKMKLYSVRMYKNYITGAMANDFQVKNYAADLSTFMGINVQGSDSEYIKDGLILNLDASNKGSYSNQWNDLSESKNHASTNNYNNATWISPGDPYSISSPSYPSDPDRIGFKFDGTSSGYYMRLARSLGRHQNYTIELVASTPDLIDSDKLSVLSFKNDINGRVFHMHYPWEAGSSDGIWIDSPWGISGLTTIRLNFRVRTNTTLPYSIKKMSQWSITRESGKNDGLIAYMNTAEQGRASALQTLPEMKDCFIGCDGLDGSGTAGYRFKGYICAVRVYNRKLTDKERQHNYLVDKKRFSLISPMKINP